MHIEDDVQSYDVSGRVAALIRWLVRRMTQINGHPGHLKLEFHCAGSRIRPVCALFEDEDTIEVK